MSSLRQHADDAVQDIEVIFEASLQMADGDEAVRKSLSLLSPWKKKYFVLIRHGNEPRLLYYNKKPKHVRINKPSGMFELTPYYQISLLPASRGKEMICRLVIGPPLPRGAGPPPGVARGVGNIVRLSTSRQDIFLLLLFFLRAQTVLKDQLTGAHCGECFVVRPEKSEEHKKIGACGAMCILHVSQWGIILALELSRCVLAQWPLRSIRWYECTGRSRLTLETGNQCSTGAGQFNFRTRLHQDSAIYDCIDTAVNEQARLQSMLCGGSTTASCASHFAESDYNQLNGITMVLSDSRFTSHLKKISRDIYDQLSYEHLGGASGALSNSMSDILEDIPNISRQRSDPVRMPITSRESADSHGSIQSALSFQPTSVQSGVSYHVQRTVVGNTVMSSQYLHMPVLPSSRVIDVLSMPASRTAATSNNVPTNGNMLSSAGAPRLAITSPESPTTNIYEQDLSDLVVEGGGISCYQMAGEAESERDLYSYEIKRCSGESVFVSEVQACTSRDPQAHSSKLSASYSLGDLPDYADMTNGSRTSGGLGVAAPTRPAHTSRAQGMSAGIPAEGGRMSEGPGVSGASSHAAASTAQSSINNPSPHGTSSASSAHTPAMPGYSKIDKTSSDVYSYATTPDFSGRRSNSRADDLPLSSSVRPTVIPMGGSVRGRLPTPTGLNTGGSHPLGVSVRERALVHPTSAIPGGQHVRAFIPSPKSAALHSASSIPNLILAEFTAASSPDEIVKTTSNGATATTAATANKMAMTDGEAITASGLIADTSCGVSVIEQEVSSSITGMKLTSKSKVFKKKSLIDETNPPEPTHPAEPTQPFSSNSADSPLFHTGNGDGEAVSLTSRPPVLIVRGRKTPQQLTCTASSIV